MKKHVAVFAVSVAFCLSFAGCKKSEESQAGSGPAGAEPTSAEEAAIPSGPVELKLKWPVGGRMVQRMDMTQISETTVPRMPNPMKQEMTMGQDFALTVLSEREAGGRELEMEFLGSQMMVTMGERTLINFDSHAEAVDGAMNPLASTFRKMVGARLKFLLDASNKVEKVEGLDEFKKRVMTDAPREAMAILNSMFTEDYFKQMVNYGQGLPPKPVSPGDTWPVQLEMAMGPLGTMVLDLNYTFKGWEKREKRNCAVLDYTGTISTKAGGSSGPMGMNISIEDGKSSGTTWFEPQAGMFVQSAIKQDIMMLMTMPNLARGQTNAAAASQTFTNRMNQQILIKVAEVTGWTP